MEQTFRGGFSETACPPCRACQPHCATTREVCSVKADWFQSQEHDLEACVKEATCRREDVVTVKQLKAFVLGKDVTLTVLKDRLRRMGAQEDKNCCVGGVTHGRGFIGVKYTPDSDDVES